MNNLNEVNFPLSHDIHTRFQRILKIGSGTYGKVYKAREVSTGNFVAIKKFLIPQEKEGFPVPILREIQCMQSLNHENVVKVVEICKEIETKSSTMRISNYSFYMIMEFCQHDLAGLITDRTVQFSLGQKKMILKQLFTCVEYIHSQNIIHRDLKSPNILITAEGVLKLADFGLARLMRPTDKLLTAKVVTLCYRPPEVLLGDMKYGKGVDMWSAGCIMVEMWLRFPIFYAREESVMLQKIIKLCGSITTEVWPGFDQMPLCKFLKLEEGLPRRVVDKCTTLMDDTSAIDLADRLLVLDPKQRMSASQVLNHEFFHRDPLPCDYSVVVRNLESKFSLFEYAKRDDETRLERAMYMAQRHEAAAAAMEIAAATANKEIVAAKEAVAAATDSVTDAVTDSTMEEVAEVALDSATAEGGTCQSMDTAEG